MDRALTSNSKILDLVIAQHESDPAFKNNQKIYTAALITHMLIDPDVRKIVTEGMEKKNAAFLQFAHGMGEDLNDYSKAKLNAILGPISLTARTEATGLFPRAWLEQRTMTIADRADVEAAATKDLMDFIRDPKHQEKLKQALGEINVSKNNEIAIPAAKEESPQLNAMEKVLDRWLKIETFKQAMKTDGGIRLPEDKPHNHHAVAVIANIAGRYGLEHVDVSVMTRDTFNEVFVDDQLGQTRLDVIKRKVLAAAKDALHPFDAAIAELTKYENPEDRFSLLRNAEMKVHAREALEKQTKAELAAPQPAKDNKGATMHSDGDALRTAGVRHRIDAGEPVIRQLNTHLANLPAASKDTHLG